jgi:glycosyltransferase involved in cell wall biosynthesis
MTNQNSFHTDLLLRQLQQVMRFQPDDIETLCEIGRQLAQRGLTQETRKCYRAAVDALRRLIHARNVDRALMGEESIYTAFVKIVEDEQHYYRCFADWKDDLAALGRRFRDPSALSGGGADQIAFFLHSGHILGHTEVLLKMLESRPRTGQRRLEPRIYILDRYKPDFMERCRAVGVEVVPVIDALGPGALWEARFLWLRKRFQRDCVGVCVWVSYPPMAAFALSMRLAPVQIFWALRFHPISGPYIDGYITYGTRQERERLIGKQSWKVVPVPLTIATTSAASDAVAGLRARFPQRILAGTLAREEKINQPSFLAAVSEILRANPGVGYVWTGRTEHPGISNHFRTTGVADRCHFVGWVDTKLYAAALDLFLESFPFGTGVIPYQALGAGVALLSYFSRMTVFGVNFWSDCPDGIPENLASYPILCARSSEEYVQLANKLLTDPEYRSQVASRGKQFFEQELNNVPQYSERFFATINEIAAKTLETRAR